MKIFWLRVLASFLVLFRLAIAAAPYFAHKTSDSPLVWPPIGSIETFAVPMAVILIGVFGAAPALFRTKSRAKFGFSAALVATVGSLVFYTYLQKYVIRIDTPFNGTQYRTIGSQRSDECLRKLPGKSDEEILEIAGLSDGDIKRMWTPNSVFEVRLELFIAYLMGLASLNFTLGALARATGQALGAASPRT
jgi:hypothetical protein